MSWGQYNIFSLLYSQHVSSYFNVSRLELGGIFLIFNKRNTYVWGLKNSCLNCFSGSENHTRLSLLLYSRPGFKTRSWAKSCFFSLLSVGGRPVSVCFNGKLFHHNPWNRVEKQSALPHFCPALLYHTGCLRPLRAGTEPLAWQGNPLNQ